MRDIHEESALERRRNRVKDIKAVVLVGGGSRRMGRPKQTLLRGGRTLVEISAAAVEGFVDRIVLAGEGPVPPILESLRRLSDPPDAAGPLGGILAAMRWAPDAAWIVVACDMPLIRPQAVEWLVSLRSPGVWAVLPRTNEGRVEPLFALYETQMKDVLERRAVEGRLGFQDLAGFDRVRCPMPPDGIREAWTNVNTMEDFRRSSVLDV